MATYTEPTLEFKGLTNVLPPGKGVDARGEERGGRWFPCVGARCLGVKTTRCDGDEARLYLVQKRGGGAHGLGDTKRRKSRCFF